MSNHICPKCETAVIAAWRQEIDGNYYHDRCLPFRGLLNQAESELTTLRQRAERAEARIAELEQAAKRQAAAALAGMDAVKTVSSWEMQEARRLKAECSPASVASQREANERLTIELEAAKSTIAELNATVERVRLLLLVLLRGASCKVLHENGDAHHAEGLCPAIERFRAALGEP